MKTHYHVLDVLRFFAAFIVLTYHLCFYGWAADSSTTAQMLHHAARYDGLAQFTWFGFVGVEIFFTISGFVIALSVQDRGAMSFLRGRIARLFPAAWVCGTITLLAWLLIAHRPLNELLGPYAATMTLWILPPWVDGVYWTLAVEAVFYALVFVILARHWDMSYLPWLLTALTAGYLLITHSYRLTTAFQAPPLNVAMQHADLFLLRAGSFFAVGIWLSYLSRRAMTPLRYAGLCMAFICCVAFLFLKAAEHGRMPVHLVVSGWPALSIWLGAFALMAALAYAPQWFKPRSKAWETTLEHIGRVTYPLYLLQNVVGASIIRVAVANGLDRWVALSLSISIVLALAYLISATVELWLRRWVRETLNNFRLGVARPAH